MKSVFRFCVVAVLARAIPLAAAPQQGTSAQMFRESLFTAEQASRGEQVYAARCVSCHGDNLVGMEMAPPLAGANFRKNWDSQLLLNLANRIRTTMPPTAPNSLSANQTTDLLSFILKANEIAAGNVPLSLPLGDRSRATWIRQKPSFRAPLDPELTVKLTSQDDTQAKTERG